MAPEIHAMPWGGTRIRDSLGKSIPPELDGQPIGESWEVSSHPNGVSRVANGPLAGLPLSEVVRSWGPLLMGKAVSARHGGAFPLLVKLIEVNGLASLQVHPNDEQARRLEGFPNGKSEAWYVMETSPQAQAFIGFKPGTDRERFLENLACCNARDLIAPVDLRPGDCVALEPGTVHACGNGILILEIQQSCDITYRVYDWDRTDDKGRKRELHIDKAIEVIDFAAQPRISRRNGNAGGNADGPVDLLRGAHFRVFEVDVRGTCLLPPEASCASFTVIEGRCSLATETSHLEVRRGETVLLPAGLGCALEGSGARVVGAAPVA
jgi:mannose-6-phosphate isomerase